MKLSIGRIYHDLMFKDSKDFDAFHEIELQIINWNKWQSYPIIKIPYDRFVKCLYHITRLELENNKDKSPPDILKIPRLNIADDLWVKIAAQYLSMHVEHNLDEFESPYLVRYWAGSTNLTLPVFTCSTNKHVKPVGIHYYLTDIPYS